MGKGAFTQVPMKIAPDAEPLRPEELRALRCFLRQAKKTPVLEEHLEPAEVAKRLALSKRTVLDLVRDGAFPHATKPFPNKVRIPVSDVLSFLRKNRPQAVQTHGLEASDG